jgi:hypothetical protein
MVGEVFGVTGSVSIGIVAISLPFSDLRCDDAFSDVTLGASSFGEAWSVVDGLMMFIC